MNRPQDELIARLRQECVAASDGELAESDLDELLLSEFVGAAPEINILNEDVRTAIDQLAASSENVTPNDRQQLLDAARRGVRFHLRSRQPLQLVLEDARVELGLDKDALASELNVTPAQLSAYEAGNETLMQLPASMLALWVHRAGIPTDLAGEAVRRSLSLASSSQRLGGAGRRGKDDGAANEFIGEFLGALEDLRALQKE